MRADELMLRVGRALSREAALAEAVKQLPEVQKMQKSQRELLGCLREAGIGSCLEALVSLERAILEMDLERHANSKAMESSLRNALLEFDVLGQYMAIVGDLAKYAVVNNAYSLPKHRRNGLPMDEARQAFRSHIARLGNLDKARLSDTEKALIDARKANMQQAAKLYAERQAKALGVELPASRLQGEGA